MTSRLAVIWSRLKSLIYRARILLSAILLLAFGLISSVTFPSEQAFRWWGLCFQIVGLLMVIWQLWKTAESFDQPAPQKAVLAWLLELRAVFAPPRTINASANILAGGDIVIASATLSVIRANPSVEDRLDDLDTAIKEIRAKADEKDTSYVQRFEAIDTRINTETQSIQAAHGVLAEKVKGQAVGDLYPALIGVFITLIGTIASTLPEELACLFDG